MTHIAEGRWIQLDTRENLGIVQLVDVEVEDGHVEEHPGFINDRHGKKEKVQYDTNKGLHPGPQGAGHVENAGGIGVEGQLQLADPDPAVIGVGLGRHRISRNGARVSFQQIVNVIPLLVALRLRQVVEIEIDVRGKEGVDPRLGLQEVDVDSHRRTGRQLCLQRKLRSILRCVAVGNAFGKVIIEVESVGQPVDVAVHARLEGVHGAEIQ